jgi:hypothetical protein
MSGLTEETFSTRTFGAELESFGWTCNIMSPKDYRFEYTSDMLLAEIRGGSRRGFVWTVMVQGSGRILVRNGAATELPRALHSMREDLQDLVQWYPGLEPPDFLPKVALPSTTFTDTFDRPTVRPSFDARRKPFSI